MGIQSAWESSKNSMNYFTQTYAASSFNAFKARSTEDIGDAVCGDFISAVIPGLDSLDSLMTLAYCSFERLSIFSLE